MSKCADKSEPFEGRASVMRESPWLAATDLDGLGDVKVVIEKCYRHTNPVQDLSRGGKKEKHCYALKFIGKERQLWLNASHRKALTAMFGGNAKDWQGKQVVLYTEHNIKAFGELVDGIRIRIIRDKPNIGTSTPTNEESQQPQEPTQPEPPKQESPQSEGEVSKSDIDSLKKLWFAKYGSEFAGDKDATVAAFKGWVSVVVQRNLDSDDVSQWKKDDLTACIKRLSGVVETKDEPATEAQPDEIPFGDDNDTGVI